MSTPEFVTVTITGPDTKDLIGIVHELVQSRLAACGNVIPGVTSIYRWNDAVKQEPESIALIHTRAALIPRLEAIVTEIHPYDVPQIVALPISLAHSPYLDWINSTTQPQPD